jgi:hypothetical protein
MEYAFEDKKLCVRLDEVLVEWEGTPFVPFMAKKNVGVDCIQFAHAVFYELGICKNLVWPKYGMKSGNPNDFDRLCDNLETLGNVVQISLDEPAMHGDVLMMSSGRVIHHMGIFTPELGGSMWQATPRIGVTRGPRQATAFSNHVKRVYRVIKL